MVHPGQRAPRSPLRSARELSALSRAAAAEKLGISQETLRRYEIGEREPDGSTLLRMSQLYEQTVDELLGVPAGGPTAREVSRGTPNGGRRPPTGDSRREEPRDYYRGLLKAAHRLNALASELIHEATVALDT